MRSKRVYLAIDLGASSGRAVAGEFDGTRIHLREHHRFPNGPVNVRGKLHWNILQLLSDVKEGIRKAAAHYPGTRISVGIDSWGVDYGLLDACGNLLVSPFHYRDLRVQGMDTRADQRIPVRDIYEVTGIQFLPLNTLYQVLSDLDSPYSAVAARLLFIPDLFNFWLTGVQVNEYTIASTSQLLDARQRSWARDLMRKLEIPADWFAEIVAPGTSLGSSLPEVARETGGTFEVVAPACHDTASAVAAVPAQEQSYAFLSSGTWSLMGLVSSEPIITEASFRAGFANEGGVDGTFRFLKNISGLWLLQECRRTWAESGEELSYDQLSREAAKTEPFVALIDPDATLFQTPGDMPARIHQYCNETGQAAPQGKGQMVRAVLESLALKYKFTMHRLEQVGGQRLPKLHIVGGGAQNTLLNQFTSDALNRPVVAGPVEATSTGNILMQMMAKGEIRNVGEGRELVRASFQTNCYHPREPEAWEEAYGRFLEVTGMNPGIEHSNPRKAASRPKEQS